MRPYIIALAVTLVPANIAFGKGNAALIGGKTTSQAKQTSPATSNLGTASGIAVSVNGFWQFFSSIPIGLGGFYSSSTTTGTGPTASTYKTSTTTMGPAAGFYMGLPSVDVYVSAGYVISGGSKLTATKSADESASSGVSESSYSDGIVSGTRLSCGIGFPVLAGLSVILDYTRDNQTFEFPKSTVTRASDGSTTSLDFSSTPVTIASVSNTIGLGLGFKF